MFRCIRILCYPIRMCTKCQALRAYTLLVGIIGELFAVRPADINKFDKTMKPQAPARGGGEKGPPGKMPSPGTPLGTGGKVTPAAEKKGRAQM